MITVWLQGSLSHSQAQRNRRQGQLLRRRLEEESLAAPITQPLSLWTELSHMLTLNIGVSWENNSCLALECRQMRERSKSNGEGRTWNPVLRILSGNSMHIEVFENPWFIYPLIKSICLLINSPQHYKAWCIIRSYLRKCIFLSRENLSLMSW